MTVDQALERADYIVIAMTPTEEAVKVLAAEVRRLQDEINDLNCEVTTAWEAAEYMRGAQ